MICTTVRMRPTTLVGPDPIPTLFEHAVREQVMRQIGVVIGLTVLLTFPVTMVSGAKSQKHSDHSIPFAGQKASTGMPEVSGIGEQDRSRPIRQEPRR